MESKPSSNKRKCEEGPEIDRNKLTSRSIRRAAWRKGPEHRLRLKSLSEGFSKKLADKLRPLFPSKPESQDIHNPNVQDSITIFTNELSTGLLELFEEFRAQTRSAFDLNIINPDSCSWTIPSEEKLSNEAPDPLLPSQPEQLASTQTQVISSSPKDLGNFAPALKSMNERIRLDFHKRIGPITKNYDVLLARVELAYSRINELNKRVTHSEDATNSGAQVACEPELFNESAVNSGTANKSADIAPLADVSPFPAGTEERRVMDAWPKSRLQELTGQLKFMVVQEMSKDFESSSVFKPMSTQPNYPAIAQPHAGLPTPASIASPAANSVTNQPWRTGQYPGAGLVTATHYRAPFNPQQVTPHVQSPATLAQQSFANYSSFPATASQVAPPYTGAYGIMHFSNMPTRPGQAPLANHQFGQPNIAYLPQPPLYPPPPQPPPPGNPQAATQRPLSSNISELFAQQTTQPASTPLPSEGKAAGEEIKLTKLHVNTQLAGGPSKNARKTMNKVFFQLAEHPDPMIRCVLELCFRTIETITSAGVVEELVQLPESAGMVRLRRMVQQAINDLARGEKQWVKHEDLGGLVKYEDLKGLVRSEELKGLAKCEELRELERTSKSVIESTKKCSYRLDAFAMRLAPKLDRAELTELKNWVEAELKILKAASASRGEELVRLNAKMEVATKDPISLIEKLREEVRRMHQDLEESLNSRLSAPARLEHESAKLASPSCDCHRVIVPTAVAEITPRLRSLSPNPSSHGPPTPLDSRAKPGIQSKGRRQNEQYTHHNFSTAAEAHALDQSGPDQVVMSEMMEDFFSAEISRACEQVRTDLMQEVESLHMCSSFGPELIDRLLAVEKDVRLLSSPKFLKKATFVSLGFPTETLETDQSNTIFKQAVFDILGCYLSQRSDEPGAKAIATRLTGLVMQEAFPKLEPLLEAIDKFSKLCERYVVSNRRRVFRLPIPPVCITLAPAPNQLDGWRSLLNFW